jgi:UDP-glucose:(glucosyl)LPS alpha-1,2-glucosyltransferase
MERNELDKNAMGGTELLGLALEKHVDSDLLNQFQIIRGRVRELDPEKLPILWLHDLPGDGENEHLRDERSRARFKKIVFVSDWQKEQFLGYMGIPQDSRIAVIKNAIEPIEVDFDNKADDIRLIYHSTPHRGLNILLAAFEKLSAKYGNISLDVFSSFNLYGWPQRDEEYKKLFEFCENHPKINYHGTKDNKTIRDALAKSHIFAYPSIWPETSCLCAMEAMSAGCLTVAPNYAALPETLAGFGLTYQWDQDQGKHAGIFMANLEQAINLVDNSKDQLKNHLMIQKQYADYMYNWRDRAKVWEGMLNQVLVEKNFITFQTS